jgi:glutathione synthase/RimK-type ligase-like ATP-grasp enzyme
VGSTIRVARHGEWRTNVSLGGSRRAAPIAPDAWSLGIAAAGAIGTDLAGLDLAPTAGGWVLLELNGAVDFDEQYRLGASVYADVAAALGLWQPRELRSARLRPVCTPSAAP